MAMQRADTVLPGAESVLSDAPEGSIGAAISAFHAAVVVPLKVTPRRAYERTLVLLVRDLADRMPTPAEPVTALSSEALANHLRWRAEHGLVDAAEMIRAALHLTRLAAWLDDNQHTSLNISADELRAIAVDIVDAHSPRNA